MKKRNPLFVAGFPYTLSFIGYVGLRISDIFMSTDAQSPGYNVNVLLFFTALIVVSAGYYLYWLILTARILRHKTGQKIPLAILLIIPFANYWWMWRYSQSVEQFTNGKVQGVVAFAVLALTGPIGAGILQDYYNKQLTHPKQ